LGYIWVVETVVINLFLLGRSHGGVLFEAEDTIKSSFKAEELPASGTGQAPAEMT
jgi:hypothetical protein